MKLDSNSTIGGQPVKVVRDLLRRHGGGSYISVERIAEHLQKNWWHTFAEDLFTRGVINRDTRNYARSDWMSRKGPHWLTKHHGVRVPKMPDFRAPARALVGYLLAEGYIERAAESGGRDGGASYTSTIKGAALGMTKFVSRIDRAKAEALLKGVLERVAAINSDPEWMHWVTEVRVFGSYLTDANDLGDLDLALKYEPRWDRSATDRGTREFSAAIEAFAAKHNKQHRPWIEKLSLPERVVAQRVKGRSPYISMHRVEELDNNPEMRGKTVYTLRATGNSREDDA